MLYIMEVWSTGNYIMSMGTTSTWQQLMGFKNVEMERIGLLFCQELYLLEVKGMEQFGREITQRNGSISGFQSQ